MERDLDASEFRSFHDLIHRLSGIHYPEDKVQLLGNRLRKRMKLRGITDYLQYLGYLQQRQHATELQEFLDSITTNETYFFRCKRHWDLFAGWVREQAAAGAQSFRIWSAAASNGSEAYTILIVLEQVLGRDFGGRRVDVLATDLNHAVLEEAKTATYRPYALSQTPADVVAKWFEATADGRFRVCQRLAGIPRFRAHNLMEPMSGPPFDFVFLRNVMIYFDRESKERVLQHVHKALRPDGVLMVGESESLLNVGHQFRYVRPSWFVRTAATPTASPARG